MSLLTTREIVTAAYAHRRGVGAFNVIQVEHAEAIVRGAEAAGAPVILQISENAARYHGSLAPILAAMLEVARESSTGVSVHLDHATDPDLVRHGVTLGVSSVMFDAARLDYDANVALTREMSAYCHAHAVFVEAELGAIGGKDGVHAAGARTDPGEATRFVDATGVDALAVAVGTSHAMLTRDAAVDLDLIAALHAAVPVPLVLHGSSGVSDADLRAAVAVGMTKVNIATQLNKAFTAAVRAVLADDPRLVDPRRYLGAGREAVVEQVRQLLTVLTGG